MGDLLLLLDGLMKVALAVSAMVWVATLPSPATPASQRDDDSGPWGTGTGSVTSGSFEEEPDQFEYSTNIDGTPMCGDVDTNGNVFGITESHSDSWTCHDTSSMFD